MATHVDPINITVLISGNGSNLQALIDDRGTNNKLNSNGLKCNIIRVISNRKGAKGLTRAINAGIETSYHNLVAYKNKYPPEEIQKAREEYDKDLAALVLKDQPDLVVCAGFMHVLSTAFLNPLKQADVAIINLHPALRGEYNGANAIERAHADFMEGKITKTGVMIHYVIDEVDMGEPIIQIRIPLTHPADDKIEDLESRIHDVEHVAIVDGTRSAAQQIRGQRPADFLEVAAKTSPEPESSA